MKKTDKQDLRKGVFRRLFTNPLSAGSMILLGIFALVSIFGYVLSPDRSPNANRQHLELSARKPGFSVGMLKLRKNSLAPEKGFLGMLAGGREDEWQYFPLTGHTFLEDSLQIQPYTGDTGIVSFRRSFHYADVLYPVMDARSITKAGKGIYELVLPDNEVMKLSRDLMIQDIKDAHIISRTFLLGTDRFGRDLLSRIILGTRISFAVGFIAVLISLIIGLILGMLAGYYQGITDKIIMWLINVVWSVPTLLLVISLTLVLGKGFWQIFVAVGISMWVEVARLVRGQVMGIRRLEYIEAAKVLGYSNFRIMFRHILPNIIPPLIIISASNFASAILIEAGLSFLGIGIQPPVASWGSMIRDHYGYIIVDKAYLAIIPGTAIMLLVLAFTLLGNGLRDALDVKRTS
jgi:peptide/nickel transport system permease protein